MLSLQKISNESVLSTCLYIQITNDHDVSLELPTQKLFTGNIRVTS